MAEDIFDDQQKELDAAITELKDLVRLQQKSKDPFTLEHLESRDGASGMIPEKMQRVYKMKQELKPAIEASRAQAFNAWQGMAQGV